MIDHKIREYIDIRSYSQDTIINVTATFIADVMKNNKCAVFQSGFGYMRNDIPFAMIVEKVTPFKYKVEFSNADWCYFKVEDFSNGDHICDEWSLNTETDKINNPEWEGMSARELCENIFYCSSEFEIPDELLRDELIVILSDEYSRDDDVFNDNYPFEGMVAVIHTEPETSSEHHDDNDGDKRSIPNTDGSVGTTPSTCDWLECQRCNRVICDSTCPTRNLMRTI